MSDETKRRGRTHFTAVLLLIAFLALPGAASALVCGDGTLDVLEQCDEGPANGAPDSCCTVLCTFVAADTACRDSAGECDLADVCSGTSGTCDDLKSTDVCRPSAGVCDPAESCDGVSNDCPADAKSSAVCRPGSGVCDVAESCDGVGDDCPADAFAAPTVECRPSAGVCDLAEHCTGASAACPADAKSTAVCRPGSGVCDAAESCDGVGDACPADAFAAPSVTCRPSAGVCDLAEHCTGASTACPADAKSTAVCRPGSGVCDAAESCDGVGDACPADAFAATTVACRPSAGVCDVAEHCTGASAACPSDAFAPATVQCRPAAGVCDAAEQCTGASAACPADVTQPDDTPCDDGNVCSTNDRCVSGACGGFIETCGDGVLDSLCAEQCDDGNLDPGDGCDASCQLEPCGPAPVAGCRAPVTAGKASVQIVSHLNPEKNKLQWKYSPGATTPKADFGAPTIDTSYQFCIYEEIGGQPRLAASYAIPAAGTCHDVPCWKESKTGFKYVNKDHTPQGIAGLQLKQGLAPGKTKILLKGKGANMPMPVLPLIQDPNVVLQLKASNGVCWEASYGIPAFRNQPDQFRDK